MADAQKPIMNIADAPMSEQSHGKSFAAKFSRIGPALGLTSLGLRLVVVPPGKRAWPFHKHHIIEEAFFILSGNGECRYGKESYRVEPGDVVAAPAGGEAHQLVNTGKDELRYLALSSAHGGVDVVEYPDTGRVAIAAGIKNSDFKTATYQAMGKVTPQGYWDDED